MAEHMTKCLFCNSDMVLKTPSICSHCNAEYTKKRVGHSLKAMLISIMWGGFSYFMFIILMSIGIGVRAFLGMEEINSSNVWMMAMLIAAYIGAGIYSGYLFEIVGVGTNQHGVVEKRTR